jgi:hypothetical protein
LGLLDKIKALFRGGTPDPLDARKLAASSESELSASIQALPVGEKGWITFDDARRLFSQADKEEAFGEMDDTGRNRLQQFAAGSQHHSQIDFMPIEDRVYFMRK